MRFLYDLRILTRRWNFFWGREIAKKRGFCCGGWTSEKRDEYSEVISSAGVDFFCLEIEWRRLWEEGSETERRERQIFGEKSTNCGGRKKI